MSVIMVSSEKKKKQEKSLKGEKDGKIKKVAWYDISNLSAGKGALDSITKAVSDNSDSLVVIKESQLSTIPAGLRKVLFVKGVPEKFETLCSSYDTLILEEEVIRSEWFKINGKSLKCNVGAYVNVTDPASLERAVEVTHHVPLVVVEFKDDTKIPLEIVLAEAQNYNTRVVMKVKDHLEAQVVFGVLECGADGVIVETENLNDIYSVQEEIVNYCKNPEQDLVELVVTRTYYAGMGERACIDFTTLLGLDEGVLLGSFSGGGILACSETHPLPYMPTRPFRVNAGTLQSYVLAPDNKTYYLSDIRAGMELLVIGTDGKARPATVGRIKLESRPILCIEAMAPDNTLVKVFMQNDWHVRVFGVDGKPINITTLKEGDKVLGYTTESGRHVGVKVDELILEQ